jgi:hypothetical protein
MHRLLLIQKLKSVLDGISTEHQREISNENIKSARSNFLLQLCYKL